jgi:hypothetical protein
MAVSCNNSKLMTLRSLSRLALENVSALDIRLQAWNTASNASAILHYEMEHPRPPSPIAPWHALAIRPRNAVLVTG